MYNLLLGFGVNISKYPLEPAQLCKSEQRPSSLPVGPVVASLGNQTPTPNSTGTVLAISLKYKKPCILSLIQQYIGLHLAFDQHQFQCFVRTSNAGFNTTMCTQYEQILPASLCLPSTAVLQ